MVGDRKKRSFGHSMDVKSGVTLEMFHVEPVLYRTPYELVL